MIRPPALVEVAPGPLLLSGLEGGPGFAAHRSRFGPLPQLGPDLLLAQVAPLAVRGRGGAGFPMARKLETVLEHRSRLPGRRPVVVVNAAEGEPASAKDTALLEVAPHLVLDGAVLAARALGARSVHVVTAADRQWAGLAVATAVADREDQGVRWHWHEAEPRFVSGQARAVLELIAGRAGLPVTSWAPEAVAGHRGRPTLLSNAESFAHLAAIVRWGTERYASYGTAEEPGTTLLTLSTPPQPDGRFSGVRVVEVEHGAPARRTLRDAALDAPLLIGGFHGAWVHPRDVAEVRWSNAHLRGIGASLGAGSVLSLADGACPVAETARYTAYLAAETAGRCGPCRNGLPALAQEVRALVNGVDTRARIEELTGLVRGRGACAHPDGTARLVASLLTTLDDHVDGHLDQRCSCHADLTVEAL
ncbi:MAG: NADH-ubiquinone oxidoreductase-F iron-sulfur binding region domain-containing protein [Dermatophilaceae bacterium]